MLLSNHLLLIVNFPLQECIVLQISVSLVDKMQHFLVVLRYVQMNINVLHTKYYDESNHQLFSGNAFSGEARFLLVYINPTKINESKTFRFAEINNQFSRLAHISMEEWTKMEFSSISGSSELQNESQPEMCVRTSYLCCE